MTELDIMELDFTTTLLEAIDTADSSRGLPDHVRQLGPQIEAMLDSEVAILLGHLLDRGEKLREPGCRPTLEFLFACLAKRAEESTTPAPQASSLLEPIQSIYGSLAEDCNSRNHVLAWLAIHGDQVSLDLYCQLMIEDPPRNSRGIVIAFQPLFRRKWKTAGTMFPKLLEAIQHVELAAGILDFANYLTRESVVDVHPGTSRQSSLASMLQTLTFQLSEIEQGKLPPDRDAESLSEQIDHSVSLLVSLCDALGLIGDTSAISKLLETMDLKHRRIQTEAAAALTRLGHEAGKQKLLAMIAEPVARMRVVSYAEELGFAHEIPSEYLTEESEAASQLAIWLSQPAQMGFAPSSVEAIDRRQLFWPGFDQPIECILLKYQYSSAAGVWENIGLCGPMTYVFAADLKSLSQLDQYAAFAGWQASHEELFEIPYAKACIAYRRESDSFLRVAESSGYLDIEPQFMGLFFGEKVLVCRATFDGQTGTVIVDEARQCWIATGSDEAPICANVAYCVYKGRRLLGHFNPEIADEFVASESSY